MHKNEKIVVVALYTLTPFGVCLKSEDGQHQLVSRSIDKLLRFKHKWLPDTPVPPLR